MSFTDPWPAFYRSCRSLIWCAMKLYNRYEAVGAHHVPKEGGCIIASNHASFLDPPAVAIGVTHREVSYMARDTLFHNKVLAWIMHKFAVIPISRDRGDVGALKKGIQFLKSGRCVGLFPEGTRSSTGELQEAKGGIGFLIAKAGVPVVPAFIHGTYAAYPRGAKFMHPAKVKVVFGPPLQVEELASLGSGKEAYEAIGALVMQRIGDLQKQAESM